jgi:hypothetical protein
LDSFYCGYDGSGNLFVDGFNGQAPALSELPSGASSFTELNISGSVGTPGQIQWDGKYITYESTSAPSKISRLSISSSSATIVGVTNLEKIRQANVSWIYDKQIFAPFSHYHDRVNNVGAWRYPKGGEAVHKFHLPKADNFQGVAFSPGNLAKNRPTSSNAIAPNA